MPCVTGPALPCPAGMEILVPRSAPSPVRAGVNGRGSSRRTTSPSGSSAGEPKPSRAPATPGASSECGGQTGTGPAGQREPCRGGDRPRGTERGAPRAQPGWLAASTSAAAGDRGRTPAPGAAPVQRLPAPALSETAHRSPAGCPVQHPEKGRYGVPRRSGCSPKQGCRRGAGCAPQSSGPLPVPGVPSQAQWLRVWLAPRGAQRGQLVLHVCPAGLWLVQGDRDAPDSCTALQNPTLTCPISVSSIHQLRNEVSEEHEVIKKKELETGPKASYGYGGKFGTEQDRMDKVTAVEVFLGLSGKVLFS